ncbi:hypothetical protein MMC25_000359, partial [Agyrium rufum]|nr:hypothetical protein [Agyrium rufum]
ISIPILLLWNVKINLRRKLGLGSLLCLSVFAIITNIIRVVGHDLTNGQDDLVWLFFWLQIEACIAVMANSATAFRSLFARGTATVKPSAHDGGEGGAGDRSPVLKKTRSSKKKTASSSSGEKPQVGLTSLPTVAFSGLRSWMMTDPFADEELDDAATLTNAAGGTTENLPMQIRVVNSLDVSSTQRTQSTNQDFNEKARSSHEGFI